jgi:hypothetical protein
MKILGYILAGCMALAVLRVVAIIIVVANIGLLIWGMFNKPRETISLVVLALLSCLLGR